MVGPPDSGMVRPRRPVVCRTQRGAGPCAARHRPGDSPASGQRRAGYLVFFSPVAVFHARLAGKDARAAHLLPDHGAGDGIRHHFFWVARMIMMGLKFTTEVPFRTV